MTDYFAETRVYCVSLKRQARKKRVLALGFFDSVHVGHRKIIDFSMKIAAEFDLTPSIYTFDNDFFRALGTDEKLVFTLAERSAILTGLGFRPENIIVGTPSEEVIKMSGESFLDFIASLNVGAVVCGADFKFGAGGNMGAEELKNWGKTNGIAVFVMPLMTEWNRKISSRDIREYLETGEVRIAEHFLGRRYFMRGVVEHDRGVGKSFGLPTVNISVDSRKLIPAEGVYDTRVRLADGAVYRGVTNIGARPTFGEDRKAIETHILDFDGDLYGKTLSIEFVDRLRGIFKFDSKEELRAQILQDIERVRSDTDD